MQRGDSVRKTVEESRDEEPVAARDLVTSWAATVSPIVDLMPLVTHDTRRYANNRAEVSHQPIATTVERQMRSACTIIRCTRKRFIVTSTVSFRHLFRVGRHLLSRPRSSSASLASTKSFSRVGPGDGSSDPGINSPHSGPDSLS